MSWQIVFHDDVKAWLLRLSTHDAGLVAAALGHLRRIGPALGRPLVDRVQSSRFHHMKELRPGSAGATEIRILFAFDPTRRAVLLVAGDKAGNWTKWYDDNIDIADERFVEHLRNLKGQD